MSLALEEMATTKKKKSLSLDEMATTKKEPLALDAMAAKPRPVPSAEFELPYYSVPQPYDPSEPPMGFVPPLPEVTKPTPEPKPEKYPHGVFRAAPEPTGYEKFKELFVGPTLPPAGVELFDRAVKQFANRLILDTVEAWRRSSLYIKGSRINAARMKNFDELGGQWDDLPFRDKVAKFPQYFWADLKALYGNESLAEQAVAQAKLQKERGAYRIQLPPPKGKVEKGVDIAAGLSAFITKLWLLKRVGAKTGIISPKSMTGDMAVWEALGFTEQDIPGKMAGIRGGLGLIGKVPTGSVAGKLVKTGAESTLFAAVTAATGGEKEDIIISALIPVAFNAWHFAKQRQHIVSYEKNLNAAATKAYKSRIRRGTPEPTSRAHLKADQRLIDNAVARAKQTIYRDDAFAPAKDKWEAERQRAIKMLASGNSKKARIGRDILNFLDKRPGIPSKPIETQIREAKQATKAIRAEKFKAPEPVKPGLEAIAEKLPKPAVAPPEAIAAPPVAKVPTEAVKVPPEPTEAVTEGKGVFIPEAEDKIVQARLKKSPEFQEALKEYEIAVKAAETNTVKSKQKQLDLAVKKAANKAMRIERQADVQWAKEKVKPPPKAEIAAEEAEIRDLSDKTRRKITRQTEDVIRKHDIYQIETEAAEEMGEFLGTYYIQPQYKGELQRATGNLGTKGFKAALYNRFTFDPAKGKHWDEAAMEYAQRTNTEQMNIDEFIERVNDAIEAKGKVGALNEKALKRGIASGDPYFELLAMKREMLKDGLSAAEINDNIREQAKHYGISEKDIADELVPIERVEYAEKKPSVAKEMARKGRKAKAKLSPQETAIKKARTVARKTKRPAYIYERELGKFTVSKKPPTKGSYTKVGPLIQGQLTQKVVEITIPTPTDAQKARAHIIAKEKGLISHRGKPTPSYRRFAKAMTGKNSMINMTEEEASHFIAMLDALVTDYRGIARIPTSKDIITKELADKIGKFKNIGFLERFREYKRVFEKIGVYHEVYEPSFKVEISSTEELFAFREKTQNLRKLVGGDKTTSEKLFDALENIPGIKLTENEKKVLRWGRKYYDNWADRLNLPAEKRRKFYATHTFERQITEDLKTKHPLDPDLVRALDFITPKTIFNPYLQKRLGKKVGLKRDFWVALEAYENKAVKKFYYEPLIQRIRVYERFLPPNSARYLRNFITRLTNRPLIIDREINQTLKEAAQEIAKLPGGKKMAQYLTKGNASGMLAYNLTGIYYECWLGLRPASAIKNLSQHSLILAETGPIAFTKALKTIGKERSLLLAKSEFLKTRKAGYLPGVDQTFIKSLENKRRKISMAMFRAADRKNVSDAFLAGFYEAKAKGLPDNWAYKRGDEVAHKTQYLYSKLGGSQFTQTSPGRVLGVLTTWPRNWAELMNDWIRAKPSTVYQDYYKSIGKEMPETNWAARRKALWIYLALVSLAMLIHKKTPFKAIYYTGWTSIRSLVDIASGKLAGLEIPRIVGNLIAGLALGDKRRIKQSWNEIKRFVVIAKELKDIITGKKDWLSLFVYIETKKEKKEKRPMKPKRPKRPTR